MGGNLKGKVVKVTKAIMVEVADRLGAGENLLQIVESDHMPSYRAITSAVMRDDEFFLLYREGRVRQAEWHSDRINKLATAVPMFRLVLTSMTTFIWLISITTTSVLQMVPSFAGNPQMGASIGAQQWWPEPSLLVRINYVLTVLG